MLALCGIAIGMALRRDRAAGERDSTQNPTPTISTNGGESAEPPEPLTGTISVSKSGEAQFRSIREAIWRAGPGATIQVLDEEVYNESLVIDGRDRCRNLQIIAHKQATLMAPSPETVVRIEATPGVVVRGFRMNVHRAQHGVEITGSAAGVRVEDIEAVRTEGDTRRGSTTSNVAFAYVHDGASGTADEPIVLRRIQVRGGLVGVVIGEQSQNAADNVVRWVRLEDSRVLGARPGDGYLFILLGAIEDVSAERNIFANGDCAISFAQLRRARNLAIIDNTFSALNNFFVLGESQPDTEAVAIQSNLILKVNGLAADSQELDSVAAKWFARNWWEIGSANVGDAGKVAQLVGSVPVLSDDPASPDYLKPRADELAKHLKPGEEIPGHARASHSNQGVKQR
jgi:hypothetical protein